MKVAIVSAWFEGPGAPAPRERNARVARLLARGGHAVDVITTVALDRHASAVALTGGETRDGYGIRRFALDREMATSKALRSDALLEHLRATLDAYEAVLFFSSAVCAVEGLPAAGRTIVELDLEDRMEGLSEVASSIHAARAVFFAVESERDLALRLFGPGVRDKSTVIGPWFESTSVPAPASGPIGHFDPETQRYVLYVGERDDVHNVGLLVEAFAAFRKANPDSTLDLVLAGPSPERIAPAPFADPERGVHDLGALEAPQLLQLIDGALALVDPGYAAEPSSFVARALERGCPVALGALSALAPALRDADAGWTAETRREWCDALRAIDRSDDAERRRRGHNAQRLAARCAGASALARYEAAIEGALRTLPPVYRHLVASHDLADDTVRRALALAAFAEEAGIGGTVVAGLTDVVGEPLVVHSPRPEDLALAARGNVEAFVYDVEAFAHVADHARAVAQRARLGVATSPQAEAFLRDAGAAATCEIPFVYNARCWDVPSEPALARSLAGAGAVIVYAGDLTPAARVDLLIAAFAHVLALGVDARLLVCGPLGELGLPPEPVAALVAAHGLTARVGFLSTADARSYAAAFRAASIFWTFNASSVALTPLVDAMWFDVPILAYASDASLALLGGAGILTRDVYDAARAAALAKILIGDAALRGKVCDAQRARREQLTLDPAAGADFARSLFGRTAAAGGAR